MKCLQLGSTLAACALAVSHASAGVISSFDLSAGAGLGLANVLELASPDPNNDNVAVLSRNLINIDKRFDHFGEIDMVFSVTNSDGTTEYWVDDVVTNNSGVKWYDYHFELGFGVGAAFVPSNLFDFLDFDAPDNDPTPTSTDFQTLAHGSNEIGWSDGVIDFVPNPGSVSRQFLLSIDVPDYNLEIPESAIIRDPTGGIAGYHFTLRQYPTPEPVTGVLAGLAALGVLIVRRLRG